jgi:hypothetical protein
VVGADYDWSRSCQRPRRLPTTALSLMGTVRHRPSPGEADAPVADSTCCCCCQYLHSAMAMAS